jgi:pimeloyl-ACP methyl ester carboxylesterase
MGCGTALHAALLAPERIDRLVLVIPPTGWETRAAQAGEWEKVAVLLEREGVEPVIAAREQQPLPDPLATDPEIRARQAAATRAWDPTRLAQVMRGATYADLPPRDALATIACPTLILAWTGDPVHPRSTADELHGLIAGSQLHVATRAEELAGWTDLLAGFLD